ncbi:FAD-dependent oxidoreductase [Pyxidicoccus parkwayensis]|uniref:Tryptophan 2-monooxygenase n=1 Tax=Pyxidicoccus parkwayensis TaxID=2813578 RepID=A0ABX7NZN1_9BACT|nr:FAD-dependent oxidoreductase [Pyxidicoccus parkwaysis]QSQ24392.1 FAD-dependent oxidoreductase [Pyxidicoccus parkwaysis]
MSDSILDVAIIGAGVSGVYSGWRLLTQGVSRTVTIFEASDRVGGRLLSVTAPGVPACAKAELGGMRILPAVQPRIKQLLEELNQGVSPEQRIETYDFPVDDPANIAFLRGIHLRLEDFTSRPDRVPYHLSFLEHGQSPGNIVVNAIEQLVPGITHTNLNEYQRREMARNASFAGKPLYEQGFWQVLVRVISGEAYHLALDAGGYQSTLNNWNAADAIPWYLSDFGINPDYKGFKKGFQQVPLTLAQRFQEAGGELKLNTHVTGFEWKDGVAEVHFKDAPSVRARTLVLAMPRRALDLITGGSPMLQAPEVSQLVQSVTPQPLFKLFTTYTAPWWLPAGVEKGRTTTDLPVRQTYYWPDSSGQPVKNGSAMLMASYDDGLNIGFWDSFRPKRGLGWRREAQGIARPEVFKGRRERQGLADEVDPEWLKHHAPQAMVAEVQRQLGVIHGLSYVPDVEEAAFMDWGDDPFGGGWNSWNIGVKSWEVSERIIQPVDGVSVYICGEAYSDAQGWVEGALQTADRMLLKLGLIPSVKEGLKSPH